MNRNEKAFTLIELLIVVAIIGLIATMLIPYVGSVIDESRQTKVRQDFNIIKDYIKRYYTSSNYSSIQTDLITYKSNSIYPIEYLSPDPATGNPFHTLDYILNYKSSTMDNIINEEKIDEYKDPWGTKYSISVITGSLPDRYVLDLSTTTFPVKLLKISSLNRSLFNSPTASDRHSYDISPGQMNIEFRYKLYYLGTPTTPALEIKDIVLYRESSIMDYMAQTAKKFTEFTTLSSTGDFSNNLGTAYLDVYKSDYRYISTQNVDPINDLERFNTYLALDLVGTSTDTIALEIDSLRITGNTNHNYNVSNNEIIPIYFMPFDGNIMFTVISAGPDRNFNTISDNLSENYNIRLNF